MEIREFREGDVLVLAPDGSVAWLEETSAIEVKLATTLKAGFRLLVLDCAAVGQLSSAAIRILLMTSRKLDRTAGRLVLCGMNAKLKKAFSISGFDKDFTVVATREEALRRVLEPVHPRPSKPAKPSPPRAAVSVAAPAPPPADVGPAPPAPPVVPEASFAAVHKTAVPLPDTVPDLPTAPPMLVPDFRDGLAAVLLDAMCVHVSRPQPARPGSIGGPDLEALASGILAALRMAES